MKREPTKGRGEDQELERLQRHRRSGAELDGEVGRHQDGD
jgi:hypothetical protein